MDRTQFKAFLERAIEGSLLNTSQTQKEYAHEKGLQLFDLLISLRDKGFLRNMSPKEKLDLQSQLERPVKNVGELTNLTNMLVAIIRENAESLNPSDGGYYVLKSEGGKEHHLTASQVIILMGYGYVALLELVHQWISLLIDFQKLLTPKGYDVPTRGIGELRDRLSKYCFDTIFFSDFDNKLRNAFAHIDFELAGDKIIYDDKTLILPEFLKLSINADRANLALLTVFVYWIKNI